MTYPWIKAEAWADVGEGMAAVAVPVEVVEGDRPDLLDPSVAPHELERSTVTPFQPLESDTPKWQADDLVLAAPGKRDRSYR